MTDLLTPEDTGEIPTAVDPGPDTQNLAGWAAGLPPARRPGATGELPLYAPETIGVVDTSPRLVELDDPYLPMQPDRTPGPDPLPPPPPPTPSGWWARLRYQGQHRAARR